MEIDYEKVSIKDATTAMNLHCDGERIPPNWSMRQDHITKERLLSETLEWMAELPQKVRPFNLGRHYPRIANEICRLWKTTGRCERYIGALLIDENVARKRQGFPPRVASEIGALFWHQAQLLPPAKSEAVTQAMA